jgi:molybdopterin-containing oxidoreductase family iron-sulfur binding subunit
MTNHAMVVDLDRCNGCRACMEACKVENDTPSAVFWMYVFRLEEGEYPETRVNFLPRPCQHCENPPCAKVCPVGARYQNDDGIVLTDFDRCIGCRYCEVACPYGVNYFNWRKPSEAWDQYGIDFSDPDLVEQTAGSVPPFQKPEHDQLHGPEQRRTSGGAHHKGVMEKCTFCVHRVYESLDPACVTTCPVEALYFGDLDDPDDRLHELMEGRDRFRLLEELGTEPSVMYLGGTPPTAASRQIEIPRTEVER